MNFINVGESVSRIANEVLDNIDNIPWSKIKDFRNLIAHNSFGVNADEVWQIIQSDLIALESGIQLFLSPK